MREGPQRWLDVLKKLILSGTSLVVQWLRLCTFKAEGAGSIPAYVGVAKEYINKILNKPKNPTAFSSVL